MKKLSLLLLFLSIHLLPFAQKIEKFYDWTWKETDIGHARFIATIEKTDSGYARNDYYLREKTLQMRGLFE